MNEVKFNKGDRVTRTGPSKFGAIKGNSYVVDSQGGICLRLEGHGCVFDYRMFELEHKLTPHVHAKEIKAWADGRKIQSLCKSVWLNASAPSWSPTKKYRVAPDNSEELARLSQGMDNLQRVINGHKVTIDKETLLLTSALKDLDELTTQWDILMKIERQTNGLT